MEFCILDSTSKFWTYVDVSLAKDTWSEVTETDICIVLLHVPHYPIYHVTSVAYYMCTYVRVKGNRRLSLYIVSEAL